MELIRILLIEDSKPFNFLTKTVLKKNNVECIVDEVHDGKEALDYLANCAHCPDVILLDLNMNGTDGLDFLKRYEQQAKCYSTTQIFILTSSLRDEDRNASMAYNSVKGFFDKPFTSEQIKKILSSLATRKSV